jgi:hypothetical protein
MWAGRGNGPRPGVGSEGAVFWVFIPRLGVNFEAVPVERERERPEVAVLAAS